jgi:uncharacterized protein (DUF488 family)
MFYRRKVVLAILQAFGGKIDKINLYKLILIFSNLKSKPDYEFIPYKYGCYSFSLHADLVTMYSKGYLKDYDLSVEKIDANNYFGQLTDNDKKLVLSISSQFKNSTSDDLMRYTYTKYPYTAINSLKAKELLSNDEYTKVISSKSIDTETTLFTIGYEGISLEEYLNRLIKNNVKVLVDVRSNPLSQKYGFSKSLLQKFCTALNIEYVHFAEVGIDSKSRQALNNQSDYDTLFKSYNKLTIPQTISTQEKILDLLIKKQRIALTCFEADICQCHRKHLAEAIQRLPAWSYKLKHI